MRSIPVHADFEYAEEYAFTWTVLICTYNGADRLGKTLERTLSCLARCGAEAEVLVVNNASTDGTNEIVDSFIQLATFKIVVRRIFEPVAGLVHARRAGIISARGRYIAFIDDDNWPLPKYFDTVGEILDRRPSVGIVGVGTTLPQDRSIPAELQRYQICYAIGNAHDRTGVLRRGSGVWGAGMACRVACLKTYVATTFIPILTGRSGSTSLAGDDSELCFAIELAGFDTWYQAEPLIEHAIGVERFTIDRLRGMFAGFHSAALFLECYATSLRSGLTNPTLLLLMVCGSSLSRDLLLVAKYALRCALNVSRSEMDFELRCSMLRIKWTSFFLDNNRRKQLWRNLSGLR